MSMVILRTEKAIDVGGDITTNLLGCKLVGELLKGQNVSYKRARNIAVKLLLFPLQIVPKLSREISEHGTQTPAKDQKTRQWGSLAGRRGKLRRSVRKDRAPSGGFCATCPLDKTG